MQDSIVKTTDEANSGEKDRYTFECRLHRNYNGGQDILKQWNEVKSYVMNRVWVL